MAKSLKNIARLKDALYNAATNSGASNDYVKGVIVSAVSVLMATGMTFEQAFRLVNENTPHNTRPLAEILPESWVSDWR